MSEERRKRINRLKKMILGTIVALILIPVCCAVVFGVSLVKTKQQLLLLQEQLIASEKRVEELEASVGEHMEPVEEQTAQVDAVKEAFAVDTEENLQELYDTARNEEVLEGYTEPEQTEDGIRRIYLTFDDGPSRETDVILDILKQYNVKATFFVLGKDDEVSVAAYKRIVEEGHTLGMHSYSHRYREIYASVDAFVNDMERLQNYLYEITGEKSEIYRFPGGSSNRVSRTGIYGLIDALEERNIAYYDWNVSSGDATGIPTSKEDIVNNVMRGIGDKKNAIVLFHDSTAKKSTVDALPEILERLTDMENAEILPITQDTVKIQHVEPKEVLQ